MRASVLRSDGIYHPGPLRYPLLFVFLLFPSTFFLTRSLFFDLQATAPAFFNPSMSSSSLVSPRRRPLIHCCRTSRSLHRCHDPILVCLRLLWAKPRRYRSRKYSCCSVVSLPICIHSLVP